MPGERAGSPCVSYLSAPPPRKRFEKMSTARRVQAIQSPLLLIHFLLYKQSGLGTVGASGLALEPWVR